MDYKAKENTGSNFAEAKTALASYEECMICNIYIVQSNFSYQLQMQIPPATNVALAATSVALAATDVALEATSVALAVTDVALAATNVAPAATKAVPLQEAGALCSPFSALHPVVDTIGTLLVQKGVATC